MRTLSFSLTALVIAASLFLACSHATAQSTEAEVSARLIGKPLLFKGFWTDDKLQFDSAGQPAAKYKAGSFTEAGFDATGVKIKGDHLLIEGQRVALVFDEAGDAKRIPVTRSKMFGKSPEKVTVDIDGHGNADFGKELDAIFADRLSELVPCLPEYWQPFARKHFLHLDEGSDEQAKTEPADDEPLKDDKPLKAGGRVKPPKLLHTVDPRFDDAARSLNLNGNVEIYFAVGLDGRPQDMAITRPIGAGLDDQAVAAVAQYRFAPATQDGKPIKVDLHVEVNFQIF